MNPYILEGKAPEDAGLLRSLTAGMPFLTDFLKQQYLEAYIPSGGSKIKFVTGRPGSGKTHFLHVMRYTAAELGYLTAHFSAKQVWLHDFREIYLTILGQCGIEEVLDGCAKRIVEGMGYDPAAIPEGRTFLDYLSEAGEADAIAKTEIRGALREMFIKNPVLDNNFALCCSLLTGGILGYPVLEPQNRELLLGWLYGDKTVKLSQLRALGLSPSRITRYNARHLLRSLAETAHLGGYPGILVEIDDMEALLCRSTSEPIHYAKVRREDAYESIRQLIDDIDSMRYLMFFLSFDRELLDHESYGVKSYQALWFRIQNEVVSTRFNRFADIVDLDRFADEIYTPEVLFEMSSKLADYLNAEGEGAAPLDREKITDILDKAQYGGLGIPYLVNRSVLFDGGEDHA